MGISKLSVFTHWVSVGMPLRAELSEVASYRFLFRFNATFIDNHLLCNEQCARFRAKRLNRDPMALIEIVGAADDDSLIGSHHETDSRWRPELEIIQPNRFLFLLSVRGRAPRDGFHRFGCRLD